MKCCENQRLCAINAKCSDCFSAFMICDMYDYMGYVPYDLGIGGGDYVEFTFCINCGRIQGSFPLPKTKLESFSSKA